MRFCTLRIRTNLTDGGVRPVVEKISQKLDSQSDANDLNGSNLINCHQLSG
uniref:Uncharacterized protein n=1 Tax=uncultured Desulfobacterium sp. TaxID=201089 RepID=E1YIP5_9BACT|nr:unknown protein [uncultured Desulfobacterium sp.]